MSAPFLPLALALVKVPDEAPAPVRPLLPSGCLAARLEHAVARGGLLLLNVFRAGVAIEVRRRMLRAAGRYIERALGLVLTIGDVNYIEAVAPGVDTDIAGSWVTWLAQRSALLANIVEDLIGGGR